MLVDGHATNGEINSHGEINIEYNDIIKGVNKTNVNEDHSYDEDSLEMSYRNKILEYKWEIERKRYQKARLWAASNDGKFVINR